MTTLYKKVGRRYVPVSEHDPEVMDSMPHGNHLVMVYKNGSSRRYNVDPAYAPMIAAGRIAEEAIARALVKASDLRPTRKPLTEEQYDAWTRLNIAFGDDAHQLQWPSARDASMKAVEAMQEEAMKLLEVPAVKKAYEHFMLVCALTKENKDG